MKAQSEIVPLTFKFILALIVVAVLLYFVYSKIA